MLRFKKKQRPGPNKAPSHCPVLFPTRCLQEQWDRSLFQQRVWRSVISTLAWWDWPVQAAISFMAGESCLA